MSSHAMAKTMVKDRIFATARLCCSRGQLGKTAECGQSEDLLKVDKKSRVDDGSFTKL